MAKRKQSPQMQIERPRPPLSGEIAGRFLPAPDLINWICATFLRQRSPLYNPDHDHLNSAVLGCLWAGVRYTRNGREVMGTCEMPRPQGSGWKKERQWYQIREWFGGEPDFILTFDAYFASILDDASWCALIEHELYHAGQATDEWGFPKFRKSGLPVFTIRGHDVEEFAGVVRRYGINQATADVERLVRAALSVPEISLAEITAGCGVCLA